MVSVQLSQPCEETTLRLVFHKIKWREKEIGKIVLRQCYKYGRSAFIGKSQPKFCLFFFVFFYRDLNTVMWNSFLNIKKNISFFFFFDNYYNKLSSYILIKTYITLIIFHKPLFKKNVFFFLFPSESVFETYIIKKNMLIHRK